MSRTRVSTDFTLRGGRSHRRGGVSRRRASAGFTLLELLAAMAIFAVLAVMAQQAVVATLSAETRLSVRRSDLAELQRAVTVLGRDLENAAPRAVRGPRDEPEPVLMLGPDGRTLTFTRGGLPNPAGLPRSGFQRVRYALGRGGEGIERRVWRRLDPVPAQKPAAEVLVRDVTRVRFRVWSREGGWRSTWPDPEDPGTRSRLPEGIEAVLETRRFGTIRRVVSLQ